MVAIFFVYLCDWCNRNWNFYQSDEFSIWILKILIWQAFLKKDVLGECLAMDTPLYVVKEGHEPPFFTCFFEWDASKANVSEVLWWPHACFLLFYKMF